MLPQRNIMMTKQIFLFCALAASGIALAGCPGQKTADKNGDTPTAPRETATGYAAMMGQPEEPPSVAGKYGETLTIASISDPKTFNLWVSGETSSSSILNPLYESLNTRNQYTLAFEPRLAELPTISDDGLTYTYTLREGLAWSDGQPLTTDDVIFTLDVLFDPKIETLAREGLLIDVAQPDGTLKREPFKYRKVDNRTVEFTLPFRYAPAQEIFSLQVAPKHKLEAAYKAGEFNSTWGVDTAVSELVSSGPWIITEYVPAQRVVYGRNPRYYRKSVDGKSLPYLDRYVYLIVPDLNTTTLQFRNGDTDILGVQQSDYPTIKKAEAGSDYEVLNRGPGWGFEYLCFNMNPSSKVDKNLIALFSDVRFRRAVSHSINRDRIVDELLQGLGEPAYGPETPANKTFYNPDVPKFPYDLAKAKALLQEIGLTDSNNNGVLEFRGKEVRFNILTNAGNGQRIAMATILSDDLKKVGLAAQFTPINFNDMIRRITESPFDWQAVLGGFGGGPEPHSGSNIWRSSGPSHHWWPEQKTPATPWEAEIDRLWVQGAQELDPAKRKVIYDRWQVIAAEQQPFIYLATPQSFTAMRKGFGNVKPASLPYPEGSIAWNLREIFSTGATRATP